jgi:hypothetical protein
LIYLLTSKTECSESCVWFQCFSKWFSSFWTNLIPCWTMCVCVRMYKEIYWVIYRYIILIYLLTPKTELSESCVWFQCFSKWFSSFWIDLILCWMMCQCVWIYKEIYWVIYYYIILIYLLTSKTECSESCVWFQCFSKWFSSFWTNLIPCWTMCVCVWMYKEIYWVIYCYIILIYLLTSKIKLNESCVWFQCFSKWFSSFWINLIPCWTMCVCVRMYKEIYWVIYCYIILIYLLTPKIKLSESCVWFQCFGKWFSSFWINLIHCWMMCQCVWIYKEI